MDATVKVMPDVDTSHIDPSAILRGATLIEGSLTRIGPGAHIEHAHLRNVVVEAGARIVDSAVVAEDDGHGHTPHGFAARWALPKQFPAVIGEEADVEGCTIRNAGVGARSVVREAYIGDGGVGPDNTWSKVYAQSTVSGTGVHVEGPTELSEAWLGHHAVIDTCGYFEGAFSNDFYVVEFNKASGRLAVREILAVPHASRYGMNTINSTNSGNLYDMPNGQLRSLGTHVGLWHDELLSHESIVLGPCCWVAGWTKVIGKSAKVHADAEAFLMDLLATNLLPFSVSCLDGVSVTGQVTPGELFNGLMYKQRKPGWAFSCAPGAVIDMVQRVAELSGDTALADRLVELALRTALALIQYNAHQRETDIDTPRAKMPKGWAGWLIQARDTLQRHLDSGLWQFRNGEPVNWTLTNGMWEPRRPDVFRALVGETQEPLLGEESLVSCRMEALPRQLGVGADELGMSGTSVDKTASVSPRAFVGPGVQIRGASVVADNAWLWHSVVEDSTVGAGTTVSRSRVSDSRVGDNTRVMSSAILDSELADRSSCTCARLSSAALKGQARVSPYAKVERSSLSDPCIIGSIISDTTVDSVFMSYHMPGQVDHLVVKPCHVGGGDTRVEVRAIPMLGGGLRVLGTAEKPVRMECAFVGSNAVLEAGALVGFGCFVLDRLTGAEGLPPLTISTSPGPERDEIGMVVHKFANVVITHFISWAYQALPQEQAHHVGLLLPSYLGEGREAVRWALAQRADGTFDQSSPYAKYRSLALYSEEQLKAGLEAYELALSDGRWEMGVVDGALRFTGPGVWSVAGGVARWVPGNTD